MKDVLDAHMHTIASIHAYSTIREMAEAGKRRGLELIGITDHAPAAPGSIDSMYFCNFQVIPRDAYGIRLAMGAELNIIDYSGAMDLDEYLIKRLDYAVASFHDACIRPGSMEENTRAMLGAMRHPKVKIMGHPDNPLFPVDFDRLAAAAKENHVLLEVNNSSYRPGNGRGTDESARALLTACKKHGTEVIVDSDAHIEFDVGNHAAAIAQLEKNDFPEELVINTSAERFLAWIGAGK